MINDLNFFINDITKVIHEREYQKENNKRTGFLGFFRDPCGGGVCLFQDPKIAEHCAGIINLFGTDYKILLMCRVNPKKIRQPVDHDKFWILNPTPDEIRPYRILLKKVLNSPLFDNQLNKLITYTSPVDYIMNAILIQIILMIFIILKPPNYLIMKSHIKLLMETSGHYLIMIFLL